MLINAMDKFKSIGEILSSPDKDKEVYLSDQKKRFWRSKKGIYSREEGLFSFVYLIRAWEEIVGKMLAANTSPLKMKGNTLFISTKHSVFANELSFLTPQILEKIVTRFPELSGKLEKIKFTHSQFTSDEFNEKKVMSVNAPKKKEPLHPFSPEYARRKSEAIKLLDGIEDEEVREILFNFLLS